MSSEFNRQFEIFSDHVEVVIREWGLIQLFRNAGTEGLEFEEAKCIGTEYPVLYDLIYRAIMNSIIMSLARIGDPAKDSKGNENLSIEKIWKESKLEELGLDGTYVKNAMKNVNKNLKSPDFQKFRNKLAAHNDWKTLNDSNYEGIEYETIRKAVFSLQVFQRRMHEILETNQLIEKSNSTEVVTKANKCREEISRIASLTNASVTSA